MGSILEKVTAVTLVVATVIVISTALGTAQPDRPSDPAWITWQG